jgi:hypothetical protein
MWAGSLRLGLGVALALAACASTEREWMKVGERYTTEDFRRDHAACSKGSKLDEVCMRNRGWVDVSPGKVEKPLEPDQRRTPGPR